MLRIDHPLLSNSLGSQKTLAGVDGVFYARIRDRYITTGGELGKIAGATPFRTGELLGA